LQDFEASFISYVRSALTYKDEEATQKKIETLRALKFAHMARRSGNPSPYLAKKMAETGQDIEGHIRQLQAMLRRFEAEETACLLLDDNRFPTGLIGIVKNVLKEAKAPAYTIRDLRIVPKQEHRFKWKVEPLPPRYYQSEVAEILRVEERGVVESCVASGKTYMMKEVTFDKRVTTLIVIPAVFLLQQTADDFTEAFGKTFVQVISAADIKKGKTKLKPIRFVTVATLASLQDSGLLHELIGDVNMLIMDEFHHAASKSYTDLLPMLEHIYYRYGFTGTFLRNDSKTLDLWGVLSNRLYHYPAWKAVEDGFITPIKVIVHRLPGKAMMNYQKEYEKNYCGSVPLLNKILNIIKDVPEENQMLTLVDRKDGSGKLIQEYLKLNKIESTFVSGDDKKAHVKETIRAFNKKELRNMIGSTVIGEGIDVYSTNHLLLATGGKSEIKITQAVGRVARLAEGKDIGWVHDFLFEGTKFQERHLEERLDIYRNQFAAEIIYA
jgi:superfamily II DNA or RNA helicase